AISVVSKTSRLRSKSRVTSFRRAMASRARACADADRLLAIIATLRKTNNATQFCGSAMVKVPSGGMKKKLMTSIAMLDVTIATHRRDSVAVAGTNRNTGSD